MSKLEYCFESHKSPNVHAILSTILNIIGIYYPLLYYFGTNLLTESPMPVILHVLEFHRKGIPNGVQTEWNLRDVLSWTERKPEDLEMKSEMQRGGHETGECAQEGRAPPYLMGPRSSLDLVPSPIYTLIPRKHPGELWNHCSTSATFCTCEIPSRGLFRHPAGGGFDH